MIKNSTLFIIFFTLSLVTVSAQTAYNQLDTNEKRHGIWQKNHEGSKQLRYEGEFSHGKEIGLFKFYKLIGRRGVLSATKLFNANNNVAEVTFLSSRGKAISKGKMDGKHYIGKWEYFHNATSALMSFEHYNNQGELHGEKQVFYRNKQLAEVIHYKDGKRDGVSTWYSEEGEKLKEFTYVNDELHGLANFYDSTGLIVEGQYKRDKKDGLWKYYKNGEIYDEKDFTYTPKFRKKQ